MCGIFGWQWKRDNVPQREVRVKLATALALLNDKRGGTSWGYASGGAKVEVHRGMGHAVKGVSQMASQPTILAHTRMPTRGDAAIRNAHPFTFGKIVGAHNGQIYNWSELEDKYPERKKFEVDSMHLFAHLAADLKLEEELEGYGAVEYFDTSINPDQIFLAKLSGGADLSIVSTSHGTIWSSDKDHLDAAVEAAGLKVTKNYKVEHGELLFVRQGELYVAKETTLKVKPYQQKHFHGMMYGYDSEFGGYGSINSGSTYTPIKHLKSGDYENTAEWWAKQGGRPENRARTMCAGPKCTGDVVDGMCDEMENEACTGSEKVFKDLFEVFQHLEDGVKEKTEGASKGKAASRGAIEQLEAFEWDVIEGRPFDDDDALEIKALTCNDCNLGVEMDGSMHKREIGTTTAFTACKAPDQAAMRLFASVIEVGKVPSFKKRSWGWAIEVNDEIWSWADTNAARLEITARAVDSQVAEIAVVDKR